MDLRLRDSVRDLLADLPTCVDCGRTASKIVLSIVAPERYVCELHRATLRSYEVEKDLPWAKSAAKVNAAIELREIRSAEVR